jgi:MFS family permease
LKKWLPLTILGAAQFIMVLDSSVMNVSITQIVDDLGTTIQGVQLAITLYTLVMASFMLVGAKLGDIFGRDRTFAIGLAIYGLGSLITALSPNLGVLLFGWSLIEGLGAVLVIPAIAALVVSNYQGRDRALAYGLIGGVAGAAIALGPLIGGWVTTEFSWRYVFVGEVVIVIGVLLFRRKMQPAPPPPETKPKLDYVGAVLSALGLGLVVFAILKSSTWGLIEPKDALTIGGHAITPLGFSIVPFLILGGLGCLWAFSSWENHRVAAGRETLLDRSLLRVQVMRAGLSTLLMQQLLLLGTFFVLPVYLQVVLGLDAFETGKRLFPLSIAMLLAALLGPKLARRFAPKLVCRLGFLAIAIAGFVLVGTIDIELNGAAFAIGLVFFGIGAGLLVSQLGNVIMSSVDQSKANEAGGLQGTAQNLGASLGTALIGAVLIAGLTSGFASRIQSNPDIPQRVQTQIVQATATGVDVIPVDQARQIARDAGLSPRQADALASDYGDALLDALRRSLFAVAIVAILGLWFTRRLPSEPAREQDETAAAVPEAA